MIVILCLICIGCKNEDDNRFMGSGLPNPPTSEKQFTVSPEMVNISSNSMAKFLFAYMSNTSSNSGENCGIRICGCEGCNNPTPIYSTSSYIMMKNQINTYTVVVNYDKNEMGTCTAHCFCIVNCDNIDKAQENFTIKWKSK